MLRPEKDSSFLVQYYYEVESSGNPKLLLVFFHAIAERPSGVNAATPGSTFLASAVIFRLLARLTGMLLIKRRHTRMPDDPLHPHLVARCLRGDEQAWEVVVRAFAGSIFAMSYHYTGRREEAEDLTQEIFIRIYQNLGSFRAQTGSFATWALTLSRNLLIDRFRKTRRFQQFGGSAELEALHVPDRTTPGPQRIVEQAEACRILGEALRTLSPETREAVILKDLQGKGYQEMAAALGVPEGTVKSRLNRGRLALARSLARHPARREMQGSPS